MSELPKPGDFVGTMSPRIEQALTPEARQWLDDVLDLCTEARAASRLAPGVRKIAEQLSAHLGTRISRHNLEAYIARRNERRSATES